MKRKDWEELAKKHDECRVFIEFADDHQDLFNEWLEEMMDVFEEDNKGGQDGKYKDERRS